MNSHQENLIVAKTQLEFYKKLQNKIIKVQDGELDIYDWEREVAEKIKTLSAEIRILDEV